MNKEKQKIVPELRFPEFEKNGMWDFEIIDNLSGTVTAGGTPSTTKSEYWGGSIRWMNSGELNLKIVNEVEGRITEEGLKNSSTKIIPENCVLIGLAGQGKTRGTVAINRVKLCTNQSIASIYPNNKKFDSNYLYHNLDNRYNELRELSAGGQGRGGLNLKIIKGIEIPIPPHQKEQQKIANCLSSLDNLITVETEKLDHLKDHKKGLLQQLFPANGETKPQFRFSEFKNDGDWEEKELSLALDGKSSQIAKNKLSFIKKGYPVYGADGMLGYIDSYAQEDDYIAIVKDGSGVGNLFYHQGQSSLLGTLNYLFSKDDEKYILKWLYYLLQTISFRPFIKGSGIPHIYYKDYSKLLILIPENPKEQQKIANCLSSADDLIEAQKIKIKNLKKHKKGLMQQLFPNVNCL